MNLQGKICVVTGGARGIGRTIAEHFAANGAKKIYACDVDQEALSQAEREIQGLNGRLLDVTDPEAIRGFVQEVKETDGQIDVLINNAGITKDSLIQKMEDDAWDAVIGINLKGVFNMTREIGPMMMEQGSGAIVNISSIVGLDGNMGQTNYSATKGGVVSMAKSWAKEFARKGAAVRVNAVAPGFINTPMIETVPDKLIERLTSQTPLKRLGEAREVADTVTFLASDAASFITGQVIRVDGGLNL
ncbi:MAG: 3-oxoacyl-ACP reductase FabG [Spirochaetaceae bacterium]